METASLKENAGYLYDTLRLRSLPLAVKFLPDDTGFPEKHRRPHRDMGKRITICQAVTMARLYGWTMGLTSQDLICVPAAVAFGFSGVKEPKEALTQLFCDISFHSNPDNAALETESMSVMDGREHKAILIAPLNKASFEPDTITVYANPAQTVRMVQGWVYRYGKRVGANIGGKVECSEYLLAPCQTTSATVVIPGAGDRIFSMTQDDEMVFALPGSQLDGLIEGLKEAGKKIGARYPITFYQNFQPEFPKQHREFGQKLGLFK